MNTSSLNTAGRDLGRNDFVHLPRRPVHLRAEYGTLWVTEDGELADHQINAGEEHSFDGHAALTIGTLGGRARVRWVAQARPSWRQGLGTFLRQLGHPNGRDRAEVAV